MHSARSNENSLVPAAHTRGEAWHRQIWQPLKQNPFDVSARVGGGGGGEEAAATFSECDQVFPSTGGREASSQLCFPGWFQGSLMLRVGQVSPWGLASTNCEAFSDHQEKRSLSVLVFNSPTLMKSSHCKDKRGRRLAVCPSVCLLAGIWSTCLVDC